MRPRQRVALGTLLQPAARRRGLRLLTHAAAAEYATAATTGAAGAATGRCRGSPGQTVGRCGREVGPQPAAAVQWPHRPLTTDASTAMRAWSDTCGHQRPAEAAGAAGLDGTSTRRIHCCVRVRRGCCCCRGCDACGRHESPGRRLYQIPTIRAVQTRTHSLRLQALKARRQGPGQCRRRQRRQCRHTHCYVPPPRLPLQRRRHPLTDDCYRSPPTYGPTYLPLLHPQRAL